MTSRRPLHPELLPLVALIVIAGGIWIFAELADEVKEGEPVRSTCGSSWRCAIPRTARTLWDLPGSRRRSATSRPSAASR